MRVWVLAAVLAVLPAMTSAQREADNGVGVHFLCTGDSGGSPDPAKQDPAKLDYTKAGILPGFGTGGFPVRTDDKQAQAWFDQGMRLAHAFNHFEATAAFKEAQKHDPTCAMCVWGEAWSRGPTINFGIPADDMKAAAALADKAAVLARGGPEKERLLIEALKLRYADPKVKGTGDKAFAKAMDDLAKRYPDDSEIAVMAADAHLIRSSIWSDDTGLQRAIALLEGVLKTRPDDSAAIHFYIHATEMAGVAAKAEPYADKLGALAPGAGHLVHMPSHTFYQIGRYEDAAVVNLKAAGVDNAHLKAMGLPPDSFRKSYHAHNVHFGVGGAMMAGDRKIAMELADEFLGVQKTMKPGEGWLQMSSSSGFYAYARYGASIDAAPAPPRDLPFANVIWRYARGESAVRVGDLAAARRELGAMQTRPGAFSSMAGSASTAASMAEIARQVLTGRIALAAGDLHAAERAYRRGAEVQTRLGGFPDPPLWWYPVRRSLAAALLAQGRNDDALKEANAALVVAPHDPIGLKIRAEAERRLGKPADADRDLADARRGWKGDLAGFDLKGA